MSTLSVPDPIDVGEIEERDDLPTTHGKTANDWEILFQTLKKYTEDQGKKVDIIPDLEQDGDFESFNFLFSLHE